MAWAPGATPHAALTAMSRRLPHLPLDRATLPIAAALLCSWLGWLGLESWQYRDSLAEQASVSVPSAVPLRPAPTPLDAHNINRLFGAVPPEQQLHAVPLVLLASLADTRAERSRALIQSPEGSAFYGLGARLPGGALLKAIATDRVLILSGGREQVLPLPGHTTRLLAPLAVGDAKSSAEAENTP